MMKKALITLLFFCSGLTMSLIAQQAENVYDIDVSKRMVPPFEGHLKFGTNRSASGHTLTANSFYFIRDEKPWFPVMGEMHFTRFPREHWEESVIKMKESGIDIVATYIFWNYHEEKEGTFNWTGDRDLRAFAEVCKKHDVYLFLRIGPWCHGEVRNGGLPDWLLHKEGGVRKDNPIYMNYTDRFFKEINKQTQGLYFKEDGPIIGCQIENEYRFNNNAGLKHILNLKQLAISAGIDVPYYTATGWPGSNLKQTELIPVWGGYPEAPWSKLTSPLPLSENYLFGQLRNDPSIGNDLLGQQEQAEMKGFQYPYATAEMGGGNQITYHRRPIITSDDVVAQAYVKIGSGANLMGYYMYHGGSNKIGEVSTLQESKATKYPNDYPIISYDFYSPLGEWGQVRESYRDFKVLHSFLNDFGDRLATTYPAFPEALCRRAETTDTLRMSVRSDDKSGFLFICNYQRQLLMEDLKDIRFRLKLTDGSSFIFPQTPLTIRKNAQMILPFHFDMGGTMLEYATAQPLCLLDNKEPVYVFFSHAPNRSEFVFSAQGIRRLTVDKKAIKQKGNKFQVELTSSETHQIEISRADGTSVKVLVLTHEQARNCYKLQRGEGQEYLCFSADELIASDENIRLKRTGSGEISLEVYPSDMPKLNCLTAEAKVMRKDQGLFAKYTFTLPEVHLNVAYSLIQDPVSFVPQDGLLPEDDRTTEVPAESPGPRYFVNFRPVQGSSYWKPEVPHYEKSYIPNAFLQLNYQGDTGSLYQDGKLVADDYYAGLPMTFSLNRLKDGSRNLLFQIIPYNKNLDIYFEKEVREGLAENFANKLQAVSILPQYEVKFRFPDMK